MKNEKSIGKTIDDKSIDATELEHLDGGRGRFAGGAHHRFWGGRFYRGFAAPTYVGAVDYATIYPQPVTPLVMC